MDSVESAVRDSRTLPILERILELQREIVRMQERSPIVAMGYFRQMRPPVFHGTESPQKAEQWLQKTETLLQAAGVPDGVRVDIVRAQLEEAAYFWWEEVRVELSDSRVPWAEFRERFRGRYLSSETAVRTSTDGPKRQREAVPGEDGPTVAKRPQLALPAPPQPQQETRPPRIHRCYYCGRIGHVKKDCRIFLRQCFICGDGSHMAAQCPQARFPSSQRGEDSISVPAVHVPDSSAPTRTAFTGSD